MAKCSYCRKIFIQAGNQYCARYTGDGRTTYICRECSIKEMLEILVAKELKCKDPVLYEELAKTVLKDMGVTE